MEQITIESLRRMEGREGLILQGCGGNLQEWVDGINGMLTEEGILKNGSRLENVSAFEHDGLTNLLFSFEGANLDMGRLAMWRLRTHEQFGGTWLSDYVPNRLGGFVQEQGPQKPDCCLIGEDGNIFHLIGMAVRTLHRNGLDAQAAEMQERIMGGGCGDYYAALSTIPSRRNRFRTGGTAITCPAGISGLQTGCGASVRGMITWEASLRRRS